MPTQWAKASIDNYHLTIKIIRGHLQEKYPQHDKDNTGNVFDVKPSGTNMFSFNVPGDKLSEHDKNALIARRYNDNP